MLFFLMLLILLEWYVEVFNKCGMLKLRVLFLVLWMFCVEEVRVVFLMGVGMWFIVRK